MNVHITLALRSLRIAEANLGELDNPLAVIAKRHIHEALLNVETLKRIEERHVVEERGEAA